MTIRDAIEQYTEHLSQRGVESARLSAELIAAHVMDMDRAQIMAHPDQEIDPRRQNQLDMLMNRRMKHEPVPYITEEVEFYSIKLAISKGVFIPRPETETLVDAALEAAKELPHAPKFYDLCTGSCNITIALAHNLEDGEFWASDISNLAIQIANINVREHDLTNFVELREGALFNPLRNELSKNFDILVCNPPYIKSHEIPKLAQQIKDYEPVMALDGGRDGMTFIKSVLDGAPPMMARGGYIFLEADPAIIPIIRTEVRRRAAFEDFVIHKDLNGQDRVCQFRLR